MVNWYSVYYNDDLSKEINILVFSLISSIMFNSMYVLCCIMYYTSMYYVLCHWEKAPSNKTPNLIHLINFLYEVLKLKQFLKENSLKIGF